jgi:amidohydrolase
MSILNQQILDKFERLVDEIVPEIVQIRRDLHAHPELGFEENRTSEKVTNWLQDNDIRFRRGIAGTGVVGLVTGAANGKTVGFRADMDALPLTENSGVPYASTIPGKAHACGHDGHTAILMGTAKLLSMLRGELHGNVKLFFQPAEEGGGGGNRMCKEGALENPKVDAVFALHGWPDLHVGEIGVRYGSMMANSDRFEITIKGKGGHAARPHRAIDPIVMSAKVIEGLQTIVSRRSDPLNPTVITVGRIQGGSTHNIIPDTVELWGTIRTLDQESREKIFVSIKQVASSVAKMFEAPEPIVEIRRGYPALVNDDHMTRLVENVGRQILGEKVKLIDKPSMGGEDFSYYLQQVPGAMFRLGIYSEKEHTGALHTASFNFNDEAIRTGMLMQAGIAWEFLNETAK